ncbi:MAG: hypothetical protein A2Y40_05245 [Candidatus Margulisbacteria bacterium GWF2_35_9]|nr:MAG: hypothetical protein A2Y40_05245 [Candidatus Margulisbacteria bacterium GWF2_35_9]
MLKKIKYRLVRFIAETYKHIKFRLLKKNLFSSYKDYEYAQNVKWQSHESDITKYIDGQERFINEWMSDIDRDKKILDICCGDGIGLKYFKKLGFKDLTGVDFNTEKLEIAKKTGYDVFLQDFHSLDIFKDGTFDIVYSSHSLEHALNPEKVVNEFNRILKKDGMLILVLPFPDLKECNEEAHCAKYKLGTNKEDEGKTVIKYIEKSGFSLLEKRFDSYREPEIWLKFSKSMTNV